MTIKITMSKMVPTLLVAVVLWGPAAHAGSAQKTFASPAEAAQAMADAVRASDLKALLAVVGPKSRNWLLSGDEVSDRADWQNFLAAYDRKHDITEASDGRAFLTIGEDGWPFPAPIVRKPGGWIFDTAAGREEVLNRRIGRNELDTIETLHAIVDAQREYAANDADGNGFRDYARKFGSSAGLRDGLYWPVADGEAPSPLGPLISEAASEGYGAGAKRQQGSGPQPYHGYRYRILTGQGKAAKGGAYSYLVDDKLLGGFAVVAYPAKYGVSGIMSFIVSHEGVVYERNLGPETAAKVAKLKQFNPEAGWKQLP